jgi:hypothetical protein
VERAAVRLGHGMQPGNCGMRRIVHPGRAQVHRITVLRKRTVRDGWLLVGPRRLSLRPDLRVGERGGLLHFTGVSGERIDVRYAWRGQPPGLLGEPHVLGFSALRATDGVHPGLGPIHMRAESLHSGRTFLFEQPFRTQCVRLNGNDSAADELPRGADLRGERCGRTMQGRRVCARRHPVRNAG